MEPELLAAYEEMLTSEDIPLNMDDLCSTMAADSAPSQFSHFAFLAPDRTPRPTTAGRQERRSAGCLAVPTAPSRQGLGPGPAKAPTWRRVDIQPGRCVVTVRSGQKATRH